MNERAIEILTQTKMAVIDLLWALRNEIGDYPLLPDDLYRKVAKRAAKLNREIDGILETEEMIAEFLTQKKGQ